MKNGFTEWLLKALRRLPAAFVAFLFAVLIWFFVAMTKRYTTTRSIPIIIRTDEAAVTARNTLPQTLDVKFEGEGWKILSLYFTQTEWIIDLSKELTKDILEIQTTAAAAQYIRPLPEGLSALEVQPPSLQLVLDAKLVRRLPIRLNTTLEPATGYTVLRDLKLSPDSITVSGARSVIGKLSSWPTADLAVKASEGNFKIEVSLSDTLTPQVELSQRVVIITGKTEQLTERTFSDIPVELNEQRPAGQVTLIPNRLNLTVGGALSDLSRLSADSLKVSVSFAAISADTTGSVSPSVHLPEHITLRRKDPERLQYILRR
ncbi:MAG: hypothetical protein IAF08_08645 [Rhizobacter sp.]|nr:hypothetical protein [Chlorobiales bacterium]